MKDTIEINKSDDFEEPIGKSQRREKKKRKINKWGVYISLILIVAGLIWYAINLGLIPTEIIIQQAGPILIIILGILILIKSL
ncbi:hypothetical protein [Methanobacterium oryzae]|uniref:hypothetical protein n=1 Tax=Methanobacterium oryzae TaxID=69540 RepID=UPI003D216EC5